LVCIRGRIGPVRAQGPDHNSIFAQNCGIKGALAISTSMIGASSMHEECVRAVRRQLHSSSIVRHGACTRRRL
jgi:hypothetical protein